VRPANAHASISRYPAAEGSSHVGLRTRTSRRSPVRWRSRTISRSRLATMLLLDVNVLIYANRIDAERHEEYRRWVLDVVEGDEPYAVSDFVLNGYLRIVTDRRIYTNPTKLEEAMSFVQAIRHQEHAVVVNPGSRHWSIFDELCRLADAKGKLVPDAYLAALATGASSSAPTVTSAGSPGCGGGVRSYRRGSGGRSS
jgi:uncharacterized protein